MFLLTGLTSASVLKNDERISEKQYIIKPINPMAPRNDVLTEKDEDIFTLSETEEIKPIWAKYWDRTDYEEEVDHGKNKFDTGYDSAIDEQNGYIYISGYGQGFLKNGNQYIDYLLLKYDLDGKLQWYKILGSVGLPISGTCVVCVDNDGYIYVAYPNENNKIVLSKYNQNGDEIWAKIWTGRNFDFVFSIVESKGFIYLTGATSTSTRFCDFDVFLLKYDAEGNKIWERTWTGGKDIEDWGFSVITYTTEGKEYIYVAAVSDPIDENDDGDIILLKYDTNGEIQWQKTYNMDLWDIPTSIAIHANYLYVTGVTGVVHQIYNVFLLKYDLDGNQVWSEPKIWGEYDENIPHRIIIDDNYIFVSGMVGIDYSIGIIPILLLLKYDLNGELVFAKTWQSHSEGHGIESYNGYLYISGNSQSKVLLLKCNYDGSRSRSKSVNLAFFNLLERYPLLAKFLSIFIRPLNLI